MTKMAVMTIYGKNPSISFTFEISKSQFVFIMTLELTLAYFTARSNLATLAIEWEKSVKIGIFRKFVAWDLEMPGYSQSSE